MQSFSANNAFSPTMINRRNFRHEYNLLRIECEEVRLQNKRLKAELLKLINMMPNRNLANP